MLNVSKLGEFCKRKEPQIFEALEPEAIEADMQEAIAMASLWLEGLETYFKASTFNILAQNCILHCYICGGSLNGDLTLPQNALYAKYDIANSGLIVNSVSNSGSSVSLQDFSSLSNAKFMLQDLHKTPYGTFVYTFLESLQGIAIVV